MIKHKNYPNNTMILVNEKSHCLQSIYSAAQHSLKEKSDSFFILYIMPTLSFHYWNLIRKTAEQSSQNQIQNMLTDIKHQVAKTIKVHSQTLLESGKSEEIVINRINSHKINWLWLPIDLGKDFVVNIINHVYDKITLLNKQDLQIVVTNNRKAQLKLS